MTDRELRKRLAEVSSLPPEEFNNLYIAGYWMCIINEPLPKGARPRLREGYADAESDVAEGLVRKEPLGVVAARPGDHQPRRGTPTRRVR